MKFVRVVKPSRVFSFLRYKDMMYKKIIAVFIVLASSFNGNAQVPEFDKLEMLFTQGHYKRVYRGANRLLDKPEFDYSMLPTYYKSLSLFQLIQNDQYFKKHPEALKEAEQLLLAVKKSKPSQNLVKAHIYELSWLKSDMQAWASDLKRVGKDEEFKAVQQVIYVLFEDIPDGLEPPKVIVPISSDNEVETDIETVPEVNSASTAKRDQIVISAKEHIGTPYVWAGNTPKGFDCSGFTSYVMKEYGMELSRRSADQYVQSRKVKEKNVQKGDLVFFNNGSGISHVGIVVSEKGAPIVMIHSSSSKGIIITEIGKSEYWMKRLHGFGTYVN